MKRRLIIAGAAIAASVAATTFFVTQPAQASVGIHVSGTNVVEANGSTFVMRGISHAHTWYTSQTSSFANIKALGANTVRVVLSAAGAGPPTAPATSPTSSPCARPTG